jgi:hypothetical protein
MVKWIVNVAETGNRNQRSEGRGQKSQVRTPTYYGQRDNGCHESEKMPIFKAHLSVYPLSNRLDNGPTVEHRYLPVCPPPSAHFFEKGAFFSRISSPRAISLGGRRGVDGVRLCLRSALFWPSANSRAWRRVSRHTPSAAGAFDRCQETSIWRQSDHPSRSRGKRDVSCFRS